MKKLVAVAVVSLFAVAGCGGQSGGSNQSASSGGVTQVNLGLIPVIDVAPLYLAQQKGIFKKHHLQVTFKEVQTGAASMAAVMSNEYQFGFAAPAPEIQAQAQGLPITVVAGAYAQGEALSQAILAKAGSPIQSVADLAGKTVAVNALQAINDVVLRSLVSEKGGDPSKIHFIALPYPDMQAALDSGQVDAIFTIEPFLSAAVAAGAKVVSKNPQAELISPDTNLSSYFANRQYVSTHKDVVKNFVAAVTEANKYAQAHEDEVRSIIPTFTAIKADVAQKIGIGTFTSTIDDKTFEVVGKYMKQFGFINKEPDLSTLVYKP